jgi:hypothetical protein
MVISLSCLANSRIFHNPEKYNSSYIPVDLRNTLEKIDTF